MPLINRETNLILTWCAGVIFFHTTQNQATTFAITDRNLHVPVVTLLTVHNANLLQKLKTHN